MVERREKLTAQVALKDFVIPNPELIPDEVRSKITKWSDYIDYWAVDWDFRSDTFMQGWVAYRTRKERKLPLASDRHTYERAGAYRVLVKVDRHLRQRYVTGVRPGGAVAMLDLSPDEQTWLDEYRRVLRERHAGVVLRMVIYGSKARGDAHADSDLDVLIIVRNDAGALKRTLRDIGYDLAATSWAVPSILAYTQDEWEHRKEKGLSFQRAVERDAVAVL